MRRWAGSLAMLVRVRGRPARRTRRGGDRPRRGRLARGGRGPRGHARTSCSTRRAARPTAASPARPRRATCSCSSRWPGAACAGRSSCAARPTACWRSCRGGGRRAGHDLGALLSGRRRVVAGADRGRRRARLDLLGRLGPRRRLDLHARPAGADRADVPGAALFSAPEPRAVVLEPASNRSSRASPPTRGSPCSRTAGS